MGGFKRFLMVVYVIAGFLALAALVLPWYGPVPSQARDLFSLEWYYTAVEVLVCIAAVGLLVTLVVALTSRKSSAVEVSKVDGGHITVTTDAIASTAAHIVEDNSSCTVDDVDVTTKHKGHVKVIVHVIPFSPSDVIDGGSGLHAKLVNGLGTLCGDSLDGVSIEFLEPKTSDVISATTSGDITVPASARTSATSAGTGTSSASASEWADNNEKE